MALPDTVDDFLEQLASAAPTPGGGSAAAIMGAMGAALVSMVCNVTIGKKGQEQAAAEMLAVLAESETLRARLTAMVDEDIAAFDSLMAAYKLPKTAAERNDAIQAALMVAAEVPMETAEHAARVGAMLELLEEIGSPSMASDVSVGRMLAEAAVGGALANVETNLGSITDKQFVAAMQKRIEDLAE